MKNLCAKYCVFCANGIYNRHELNRSADTTNISIHMDAGLKAQANALFAEFGMNLSMAFNIFVQQSLREGRIPFGIALNQPNKKTVAAMLEAERIVKGSSVKGYDKLNSVASVIHF